MSGGGGGGGSWPEDTARSCEDLEFETALSSPQAGPVAQLHEGDELTVQLDTSNDARKVVARNGEGEVVGTITSGDFANLLRCLQEGQPFVAEVISVDGGLVRVKIRPA
jgi:hypothetical protein